MRKLLIASPAGGGGKTVTALHLAAAAAAAGRRVLFLDADPLACVRAALSPPAPDDGEPTGELRPNLTLREAPDGPPDLDSANGYDYALVDAPAAAGPRLRELIRACDEVLLVLRAEPLAYRCLPGVLGELTSVRAEGADVRLRGVLLTLPPEEPPGGPTEAELRELLAPAVLGPAIPYDPEVGHALLAGQLVWDTLPDSPAGRQFLAAARLLDLVPADTEIERLFAQPSPEPAAERPTIDEAAAESLRPAIDMAGTAGWPVMSMQDSGGNWTGPVEADAEAPSPPGPLPHEGGGGEREETGASAPSADLLPSPLVGEGPGVREPELPMFAEPPPPPGAEPVEEPPPAPKPRRAAAAGAFLPGPAEELGLLATGGSEPVVTFWSGRDAEPVALLDCGEREVFAVAFSPDGRFLAAGSADQSVRLWEPTTGRAALTLLGHEGEVSALAFSPDGRTLASGSWDATIRLWDLDSGQERAALKGHRSAVTSLAYSPDGRYLASGSWDKTLRLWDAATGREVRTFRGHDKMVTGLAYSPNGRALASASWDKSARVWDVSSGREVVGLHGHAFAVSAVAFTDGGRALATGSWDMTVKLWDLGSGHELETLRGHAESVRALALSPDGRALASASWDGSVRLWDPSNGRELAVLRGLAGKLHAVAFHPLATAAYPQPEESA